MMAYVRRHLGLYLVAIAFIVLETVGDLLQPTMMSYIVDEGVANADVGAVLRYGLAMLGIAAVAAFAAVMRNRYSNRASQVVAAEMRADMFRKVQELSFQNIDRLQPASIITRITNDVTTIVRFINGTMRIATKAPLTCVGALVLVMWQTPWLGPFVLPMVVVIAVLITLNMKLSRPRYRTLQESIDQLNGASREYLGSVRVVKAFAAQDHEARRLQDAAGGYARASIGARAVSAVFSPFINCTVNLGIVAVLWFAQAADVSQIGHLMASVNYLTQMGASVYMIGMVLNDAVRATTSAGRVGEVLAEKTAQTVAESPVRDAVAGGVEFRGVGFAYAGAARPSLGEVSFGLAPGESLGIIGPTGSGKSTLVDLVPRFYDATAGEVLVDGYDVRDYDPGVLRAGIAVVPQSPQLFSGTIASNLRWGAPDASLQELRDACRAACALEFIDRLPQGFDTPLGQGGTTLSGGQKQRLCLARALLRKPAILILDDCTSALDAATEAAVLRNLLGGGTTGGSGGTAGCEDGDAAGGRGQAGPTMLLVSQRVSTVRRADRILVLSDGCPVGLGTHDELLESCGDYRAIYASQTGRPIAGGDAPAAPAGPAAVATVVAPAGRAAAPEGGDRR